MALPNGRKRLDIGDRVLIGYEPDELEEGVLVGSVNDDIWAVLNIYRRQAKPLKFPELIDLRYFPGDRALPRDVRRQQCLLEEDSPHGPLNMNLMLDYLQQGEELAHNVKLRMKIPIEESVDRAKMWVIRDPGPRFGGEQNPDPEVPVKGAHVLFHADDGKVFDVEEIDRNEYKDWGDNRVAEPKSAMGELLKDDDPESIRVIRVKYEAGAGDRFRGFKESVSVMEEEPFGDFPLTGSRSMPWYLKQVAREDSTPTRQFEDWKQNSGISASDRAIFEADVITDAIETAVAYDQLNVKNLASFEKLGRRWQLIQQAYKANPAAPSYQGADQRMGKIGRKKDGTLISEERTAPVAGREKDEGAIMKEQRKARGERNLAKKQSNGAGKGDGG